MLKIFLIAVLLISKSVGQDLVPHAKDVGGTFCRYLVMKNQLPRKYYDECEKPQCGHWDSWREGLVEALQKNKDKSKKVRYVLSYAHNGFGNQLWQHTVAFMIAQGLRARMFVAVVPDSLSPDGVSPPNTWQGMGAMERLLPPEFMYNSLPMNSSVRQLCDSESFYLADRPRDWRNNTYSSSFKPSIYNLIVDKNPRCVKMLGYFQNYPLCQDDAKKLWTPRMVKDFSRRPGPNDISIYLRCLPRHYFFNDRHFYETILNNTKFEKVWLFMAPECPTRLSKDASRDGPVPAVIRMLMDRFNATRWPMYNGTDDVSLLLHDLSALVQSNKLIIPVSSWAYWAGLLSNASEIHVNYQPYHPTMGNMMQYIYHDQKKRLFFGRWNNKTNDVDFAMNHPEPTPAPKPAPVPVSVNASAAAAAAAKKEKEKEGPLSAAEAALLHSASSGASAAKVSASIPLADRVKYLFMRYNNGTGPFASSLTSLGKMLSGVDTAATSSATGTATSTAATAAAAAAGKKGT
jgi:hypothetical protein